VPIGFGMFFVSAVLLDGDLLDQCQLVGDTPIETLTDNTLGSDSAMPAPAETLTWSYISGTTCESADSSTRCPYLFWNGMALHGRGIAWAVRR
jgi:hypothetical protein